MRFFACILVIILNIPWLSAQEKILVTHQKSTIFIGDHISYLADNNNSLTIDEVITDEFQDKFVSNNKALFHKSSLIPTYWVKFELNNQTNEEIWLAIENTLIISLDLYSVDNKGAIKNIAKTGSIRPFNTRIYPIINGFWLPLGKSQENQTFYLRVHSHFSIDTPLKIAPLAQLHHQKSTRDGLSIAFIGIMCIMILYNGFLAYIIKEKIYLLYTCYLISMTFVATFLNSYPIIEYFSNYQLQNFWHHYFSVWSYPIILFSGLFCIEYLDLKKNLPKARSLIIGLLMLASSVALENTLNLIPTVRVIVEQLIPLTLYLTCLIISAYLYFIKKQILAQYYLLGWSFLLLGIIILIASANGIISYNVYLRNASYFGVTLEVCMFSLALGHRMNILKEEKTKRLTLSQKQKKELEKIVKNRTREIRNQKEELEKSNKKMKINQRILMKSRQKLKDTLDKNKIYLKKIEEQKTELEKRNQKVVNQNEELNTINEKLRLSGIKQRELNELKDKLFSIISHDLRSPLSSIHSFLELFLNYEVLTREESRKIAIDLYQAVKNTSLLLDNLLNWARMQIQEIHIKPTPIYLSNSVDVNIELLSSIANSKNIRISANIPSDLEIWGDKDMIDFVIRNLVSNALKFTPENGKIEVLSQFTDNNFVEVEVKDSGVGIPQENLSKLFSDTEHISTMGTAQEKGTGLGLKVCKEFIDKNKGEIWVESKVDEGTSFHFTLPLSISQINY